MSQLFTVETTAEILQLHTRTVRRYIKEKVLQAHKVGGQWRIDSDDLKKFMGISSFEAVQERAVMNPEETSYRHDPEIGIQVSSVVNIPVKNREMALRLSSSILASLQNRGDRKTIRCDYLFLESDGIARFILQGDLNFIQTMLSTFALLEQQE